MWFKPRGKCRKSSRISGCLEWHCGSGGPLTCPRLRGEVGICVLFAQIPREGAFPRARGVGKGAENGRWYGAPASRAFAHAVRLSLCSAIAPVDRVGEGGKQIRANKATPRPPLPT